MYGGGGGPKAKSKPPKRCVQIDVSAENSSREVVEEKNRLWRRKEFVLKKSWAKIESNT
jgi:hypothetical protein